MTTSAEIKTLPFIEYHKEDISDLPLSCDVIDKRTGKHFIDVDKDFSIGNSGGFLMRVQGWKFINTKLFSPAAIAYETNKKDIGIINWVNSLDIPKTENRDKYYYCPYLSGTPEYNEFWIDEERRRRQGYTAKCKLLDNGKIVNIHITGDHYNYLNYGRILRTPNEEEKAELIAIGDTKTTQIEAFPRFWDGDYWNFKVDLFIANNNYHLAKGKARGKGYSYKRGSQSANTANLVPKSTVVLAAFDLKYLTDPQATSDMAKTNLDWFEDHTHWKRLYISEDLRELELGYKPKSGYKKKGWRSRILSVSLFNNASAAIGKRAIEIDFEESGRNPLLEDALDVTLSSTEVGAANVGTIRVYGTAGVKGSDWTPFSNVFFNPYKYKMMPFEDVWDINGRSKVCGFFHPQIWNLEPYMDKDGNSLLEIAYIKDLEDKDRASREMDTSKYITYVGQRANTPEEAFKTGGENLFSSIELSNHVANVLSNKQLQYYRDGMLEDTTKGMVFRTNSWLQANNMKELAHPYIEDFPFNTKYDFYGCIREYYPPAVIDGVVPSETYYVVYDNVAKDKKSDLVINKNSLNSIQVLTYPNNLPGVPSDIIVAAYAGRPERKEDADKIALYLAEYYNAKVLVEVDTGDTVSNFKKWKKLNKLYTDPTVYLSENQKLNTKAGYGIVIGAGNNAMDGLEYERDWMYRKRSVDEDGKIKYTFHYIFDVPLLREWLKFNSSGNFDRISSLRVAMFQLKGMQVKHKRDMVKNSNRNKESIYSQIGLYGYR